MFASAGVWSKDGEAVIKGGFFQGFTPLVWALILSQGAGGLLVAAVTKYLDSVIKNYASAISITLTGFISIFVIHDSEWTKEFGLGTALVIGSSLLYGSKLEWADCGVVCHRAIGMCQLFGARGVGISGLVSVGCKDVCAHTVVSNTTTYFLAGPHTYAECSFCVCVFCREPERHHPRHLRR
jgi:hypothetical protein